MTITYLRTGLLAGEAKYGAVRARVFAPADYQPARPSEFPPHRVAPQRLMAALVALVVRLVYGEKRPRRLFWIGDSTLTPTRVTQVYAGRQQIEVNFDEVKELGLGHYQGRNGTGVRRWAMLYKHNKVVESWVAKLLKIGGTLN